MDNWVHIAPDDGLGRIEVYFSDQTYALHRHDTYGIGVTLSGIQSFYYQGEIRHSRPGTVIVLHPDEVHDGHPGGDAALQYRMLYLPPTEVQEALNGKPLPHVPGGMSRHPALQRAVLAALSNMDEAVVPLQRHEWVLGLTDALATASDHASRTHPTLDLPALTRVRALLDDQCEDTVDLESLERLAGLDRFSLSRQFRAAFGTSPYRYQTLRRLDRARQQITRGVPLADVAADCGFADQPHMTRHFKRAIGLTPGQWAKLTRSG